MVKSGQKWLKMAQNDPFWPRSRHHFDPQDWPVLDGRVTWGSKHKITETLVGGTGTLAVQYMTFIESGGMLQKTDTC